MMRSQSKKYLTEQELRDFFNSIDRMRDFLIFALIFESGLRPGEIGEDKRTNVPPLKIKNIEDVLLGRGNLIHLTRAKYHPHGRSAVLANPIIIDELRRFISPLVDDEFGSLEGREFEEYLRGIREEPVFMSQKGNALSERQIQTLFKKYAERAGIYIPKHVKHILRHTHAVAFLMRSKKAKDIESLRQNLGHSNIAHTSKYTEMIMQDAQDSYMEIYEEID